MKKIIKPKVFSVRVTLELYEKIKAYGTLNDLTLSEAIIELIKQGLKK